MNDIFKISSSHFILQCKNWLESSSFMASISNSDLRLLLSASFRLVEEKILTELFSFYLLQGLFEEIEC